MKFFLGLLLTIQCFGLMASVCENQGPNVILFTWDGVRSHEFFKGTGAFHAHQLDKSERGEIFTTFWSKYAAQAMVLGKNRNHKIASNIAISLPSYQAMMVGHATDCKKNDCAPISETSVLENVRSSLNLDKKDVAVFASWNRIAAAAAVDLNKITNGIYPEIYPDESMRQLQEQGMQDLPHWSGSRKDKYTFALGMEYLKKYCPRLLYISLVDSDEFGHEGDYPGYVRSLKTYDEYLDQLLVQLKNMNGYGDNTTVIVTTDHSRGAGPFWIGHANSKKSEKHVFLMALGRGVKPVGISRAQGNHAQIKPTIEYLMGIKPTGEILPNILVD